MLKPKCLLLILITTVFLIALVDRATADPNAKIHSSSIENEFSGIKSPASITVIPGPAPSNVTLHAETPTTVRVEWSPSPGAVRYVVSRNGAPDVTVEANASGALQGNRFVYRDVGRTPAMLHTYSVTAYFNAPYLAGRSTPVQVATPNLAAPNNLKAVIIPANDAKAAAMGIPNAVHLTWNAQGEGIEYHIQRNGGASKNPRADFYVQGKSEFRDQNLPPGEHRYIITPRTKLPNGLIWAGEQSAELVLQLRPFNIIAIGDSIMWGQGLRSEDKFATRISHWLHGMLNKNVNLYLEGLAHSGASVIAEDSNLESTMLAGEIPYDYPSILHQATNIAPRKVPAEYVDLVLVDGCINDVGVRNIINPLGPEDELLDAIQTSCIEGAKRLLTAIAETFPNAKVAVLGYYPIVSWQSDLIALAPLFAAVTPAVPALQTTAFAFPLVGAAAAVGATALFRDVSAKRSDLFYQASTNALQIVIAGVNAQHENRFRYVPLPVGPENAYAAPDSWLWLIPTPPLVKDDAFEQRSTQCAAAGFKKAVDPLCHEASMGHPNAKGAEVYTEALQSVLTPFIPAWQLVHSSEATPPNDTLLIKFQPGPRDQAGGTFTITVDDQLRRPITGIVYIDGVRAGALGDLIRYAFKENNPNDILIKVNILTGRWTQFTIPLRALSVAVNLTRNGVDERTAIVTSSDAVTGQHLNGTVTLNANSSSEVVGTTNQSLTYASCGTIEGPSLESFGLSPGPAPCTGLVHVPYYPDTSFLDQSQNWNIKRPQIKRPLGIIPDTIK